MAQWLRIRLQMQGIQVRALVWEDPTYRGALSQCSTATEQLSLRATNTEAHAPRARAPQQEKPRQSATMNSPCAPQLEKACT